jgi:hypothetical protein|tara:strand:- start:986 stop:1261 length:276 start_codon:yes stop_codon:yes gene_type:complete
MKRIDPKKYNLPPRTTLYKKTDHIFIIIDRKSRIIMKDGRRISEIAKSILSMDPGVHIRVATSAPTCSKTKEYLRQVDIEVLELNSINISL